jgi:hypothetical protein
MASLPISPHGRFLSLCTSFACSGLFQVADARENFQDHKENEAKAGDSEQTGAGHHAETTTESSQPGVNAEERGGDVHEEIVSPAS